MWPAGRQRQRHFGFTQALEDPQGTRHWIFIKSPLWGQTELRLRPPWSPCITEQLRFLHRVTQVPASKKTFLTTLRLIGINYFLDFSPRVSSWEFVMLFSSSAWSVLCYYLWLQSSLYLAWKEKASRDFHPLSSVLSSVGSWCRGSTPSTVLNVGRRGWRSYRWTMLRLRLWEVRALAVPFIQEPDKCLNICVFATHREFWQGSSVRHQHTFVKMLFDL